MYTTEVADLTCWGTQSPLALYRHFNIRLSGNRYIPLLVGVLRQLSALSSLNISGQSVLRCIKLRARLALACEMELIAIDQHLGRPGPRIIIRCHYKAVGPAIHQRY